MKRKQQMKPKSKVIRHAIAIGFVLAFAGAAPAWSQSQIGNGLSASEDPYSPYYGGHRPAPFDDYAPGYNAARHRF
jgi:hypothetical protein